MIANQVILCIDITACNQVLPQGQRRVERRRRGSLDEFLGGVGFIILTRGGGLTVFVLNIHSVNPVALFGEGCA